MLKFWTAFAVALWICGLLCFGETANAQCCAPSAAIYESEKLEGKAAPAFSLKDLNGKTVSLADLKGRVVVVAFWGVRAAPAQEQVRSLETLQTGYGRRGVKVAAIAVDTAMPQGRERAEAEVRAFVREEALTYPILLGTPEVLEAYRVEALPLTFVIDRQRKVSKCYPGYIGAEKLGSQVDKLL